MCRSCSGMEEGRSTFEILAGKPTGKGRLGRPRRRWEDNIRMNLKERCMNTRNWVDSAEDCCDDLTIFIEVREMQTQLRI